jgi:uncharacterized glyoxalase superfamily protein PhnB
MLELFGLSPVIAVADVRASIAFYARYFDGEEAFVSDDGSYAVVALQNEEFHFQRAADASVLAATARTCQVRLRVADIDPYWQRALAQPAETQRRAPQDEPWGTREFHLHDLDGALIIVSQIR